MDFVLRSGETVRVRPVRADDVAALQAGFQRLSQESRYFRFFAARPELNDQMATALTDLDHQNHYAWGVFDPSEPSEVGDTSGLGIASARLVRDTDPTTAEAALAVVDAYHGRGIGRFLIELLVHTAADIGVDTLRFEILRANRPMLRLISATSASAHRIDGDALVVEYRLDVPAASALDVPLGALYELLCALGNKTPGLG